MLLALPLLVGCAQTTWKAPTEMERPASSVAILASGTDGLIHYQCDVSEVNSPLVWVECKFKNDSTAMDKTCINVSFFDEVTGDLVVQSQKVCSGVLMPTQISTNYVAFQKENRVTLRKCGELLDLCVMLTTREDQFIK